MMSSGTQAWIWYPPWDLSCPYTQPPEFWAFDSGPPELSHPTWVVSVRWKPTEIWGYRTLWSPLAQNTVCLPHSRGLWRSPGPYKESCLTRSDRSSRRKSSKVWCPSSPRSVGGAGRWDGPRSSTPCTPDPRGHSGSQVSNSWRRSRRNQERLSGLSMRSRRGLDFDSQWSMLPSCS